jgi:hypothetical protein
VVNWYLGEMIALDVGDSQEELLEKKQVSIKKIVADAFISPCRYTNNAY